MLPGVRVRAPFGRRREIGICVGLSAKSNLDPGKLRVGLRESDSHYRMKYTHRQFSCIRAPQQHAIPPRIQQYIENACGWFYDMYYPAKT